MGLLDLFNTPEGQVSLRLLAAAGPRAGPRNTGGGLLEALGGAAEWQQGQNDRAAQEEERKLKGQYLMAQINEAQAQAAQRQAAIEQAQRAAQEEQSFLRDLAPRSASPQQALSEGGGPTQANAQKLAQAMGPDFAQLALRYPKRAKELEQLAGARDWGRQEVARTVAVAGADNMPMTRRESKFGDVIGQDTRDPVKMQLENLGGVSQAVNPFALRDGQQFQRTNNPDALLSAQTAIRGQNMTDARSRELNSISRANSGQIVETPQGYVRIGLDNAARPVAGPDGKPLMGKRADQTLTEDQGKATGWLVQAENAYKNMLAAGFDAKGEPKSAAYPGINDALGWLPGVGGLANALRTEDRQKFLQASSSLSEALLRAATGAGVNEAEAAQKIRELTPLWGEAAAVTKQKMDSIPLYIASLKIRAGPGASRAAAIGGASAPPTGVDDLVNKYRSR